MLVGVKLRNHSRPLGDCEALKTADFAATTRKEFCALALAGSDEMTETIRKIYKYKFTDQNT